MSTLIAEALPPHLSYSSKSAYLGCGERFRLEKVEKLPSTPSWAMVGGSTVHEITEVHDKLLFGIDAEPDGLDFNATFDRLVAAQVERCGYQTTEWNVTGRASKANPNKEDEAWWRENGPGFVQAWLTWRDRTGWNIWLTPEGVPAIEVGLNPVFGDVPVKQFIDRIFVTPDGELVVLDLKTGSRTPEPDQLGDYGAGIEQMLGVRPSWGTYWMARQGGTTPSVDLSVYTQGRVGYEYANARRGMLDGVFVAHRSPLCGSCGVRKFCYAVNGEDSAKYLPYSVA